MPSTFPRRNHIRESRVGRVEGKLALSGRDRGFTIIELLVVMAIIGLLAAIAIPVFSKLKGNAYDSAAQSDLRQAAIQVEASFSATGAYPTSDAVFQTGVEAGLKITTLAQEKLEYNFTTPDYSISMYDARTLHVYCFQSAKGGTHQITAGGPYDATTVISVGIVACRP